MVHLRKRTCRSLARLSVVSLALCMVNSSLATVPGAANVRKPRRMMGSDSAIAVIDSIVVNNEKTDSATADDIELIRADTTTPVGVQVGVELFKGDELTTKTNDQVTLRFLDVQNGELNLVYMDQESKVHISSACLKSGRFWAFVGINFQICLGNTTLGVRGTEFEVNAENPEQPKVSVLKGEVTVTQKQPALSVISNVIRSATVVFAPHPEKILAKEEATITSTGIAKTEIPEPTGKSLLNYWSLKMIKADPVKKEAELPKPYQNYQSKEEREREFIEARFQAVWNNDAKSLATLGKVYNDWDRGDKAAQSLQRAAAKDPSLKSSYEFQTNLGEADRLLGRYASAQIHADEALRINPNYGPAAYMKGRAAVDSFRVSNKVSDLDVARQALSQAVRLSPPEAGVKNRVEGELNQVLKENGERSKQVITWGNLRECWGSEEPISYSGTINLPELRSKGLEISGPGTLYLLGNQFKLITGSELYTGTLIITQTGNSSRAALRFDTPNKEGATVSLRGRGNCDDLHLTGKSGGIFVAAGTAAGRPG